MSDSVVLIQQYANLGDSRYEYSIQSGWGDVLTNSIQLIIKDDYSELERNLGIIRNKSFKIEQAHFSGLCYNYFVAMAERNLAKVKDAVLQILTDFEQPSDDLDLIDEFYAMPAVGFVKLAWMKGIEIEIDHPLIPKDWLPIRPIENYDEGYDFLRQYFKNIQAYLMRMDATSV